MRVGFVGAGRLAQAFGPVLIDAGHEVVLTNSRGPETLTVLVAEMGPKASATSVDKLKDECEVVILAVRWWQWEDALKGLPDWDGTIVIDAVNNREGPGPEGVIDIGDTTSTELVAKALPGARVVKALNHARIPMMAAADGKALLYCGDDAAAKATVAGLLKDIGGTPVDTGSLHDGGLLQGTGSPLSGLPELLSPEEAEHLVNA